MFAGIDCARETIAVTVANDLDTPCWHLVTKWCGRLQVNRVPGQLDKSFTRLHCVRTSNVWAPIAVWIIRRAPDARLVRGNTWRVDIEAAAGSVRASSHSKLYLLSSGTCPIARPWNSKLCPSLDICRNQHRLVTRQHSLAKGNVAACLILAANIPGTVNTIRLVWKWLLDRTAVVTVEPSILK